MVEPTLEERLAAVEARLAELERRLAKVGAEPPGAESPASEPVAEAPAAEPPPAERPVPVAARPAPVAAPPAVRPVRRDTARSAFELSASTVLGWSGAAALLLAAAYFVRIAIVEGWLTPWIQVAGTALAGAAMIGGSFALRRRDPLYTSLLGAGGIAVLYVAVYGAHVYHGLVGTGAATVAAGAVAALSLALHAVFREPVYVAFALAGSYASPLLVTRAPDSIRELAIYLAVWNVTYALYAVWRRSREVYLAAAYASLFVFQWGWTRALDVAVDAAAAAHVPTLDLAVVPWRFATAFLLSQAALFLVATVATSVRARRPLATPVAWIHFPALLLFYGTEYAILSRGEPALAPWAGIGLAVAAYLAWAAGRAALDEAPRASLEIVHAFAGVVLVHAVFLELVAPEWRPVAGLAVAAAVAFGPRPLRAWPWLATAAFLFAAGYGKLWWGWTLDDPVVARSAMSLAYPAFLYVLYLGAPRREGAAGRDYVGVEDVWRWSLLAAAHGMALGAAAWLVGEWLGSPDTTLERLWLSLAWAAIGLAWLLVATARGDRVLARSTLGIFAAFAIKVVFADLEEAGPLVRVGILVVLGITLYAGGWIYRRVLAPVTRTRS